ncbi:CDP-6-deoxy-L-threo-D-glycero-4-hexulose-3-dehydrase reductase [Gammaproteobacteria bacterium]
MSFTIQLMPSGRVMTAAPHEILLTAALRQDIALPYGCRNGQCGGCKATLLSGDVDRGSADSLTSSEQETGAVLLCQAKARSNLQLKVREAQPTQEITVRILPCRVERKESLAPDVMRLFLRLSANERIQFLPGQYVEFLLAGGRRRSFSLANPPHVDSLLELHIRHVQGGQFTSWLFQEMSDRVVLRIQGPLGSFTFQENSDTPVILMAGGTGFASIKSILEHLFKKGTSRSLHFYWGARAKKDLYLDDLVQSWVTRTPNFQYTPVLSEPDESWTGRTGFVHAAILEDYPDLSQHEVYACGPPPMIRAGRSTFSERGLPQDSYFSDSFELAKDPTP